MDEASQPYGTIYILHGDDEFAIQRAIKDILSSPETKLSAENVIQLDGKTATLDEIYRSAYSLPFFAARTAVIVINPLAKIQSDAAKEKFISLLEGLPVSSLLILIIEDDSEGYGEKARWRVMGRNAWFREWAEKGRHGVAYKTCQLPTQNEMAGWIRRETEIQDGKIAPAAAAELAYRLGNDTLAASREISKLLTYVGDRKEITAEDVRQAASSGGTTKIFDMVDALAMGNASLAMKFMRILLDEEEPEFIFPMVVRQFRQLIQTRALLDAGGTMVLIKKTLKVQDFVADKLIQQVRRFKAEDLARIYHKLLDMDVAAKTSRVPYEVSLEMMIAELGRS